MTTYTLKTDDVPHPDRTDGLVHSRNRRLTYRVAAVVLAGLIASAVLDGATSVDVWGPSTRTVTDRGGGFELTVRYPNVTRPALATPFDIVVRRDGGFTGPIDLALAPGWLEMWDYQALWPEPSAVTASPSRVVATFDPPDGDTLRIFFDARIQPAEQSGRSGFVSVLDGDGVPVAHVDFRTAVRP